MSDLWEVINRPVRRRRRRPGPEEELQRAVVEWLSLRRLSCWWCHVPNGGATSWAKGGVMKAMGVRAGAPDLLFLGARRSGGIELKAPRGRQSATQRAVEAEFRRLGIGYAVARDLDQVEAVLERWGFLEPTSRPRSGSGSEQQSDCGEAGDCGAACRCAEGR